MQDSESAKAEASSATDAEAEVSAGSPSVAGATKEPEASEGASSSASAGAAAEAPSPEAPPPEAPPKAQEAALRDPTRKSGVDLFDKVEEAGGENDPKTTASQGETKLAGQRNESSVLFSLDSLTKNKPHVEPEKGAAGKGAAEAPSVEEEESGTAKGHGSGLIDIRKLSSESEAKEGRPKASVDDIMNLGDRSGSVGRALTAPLLATRDSTTAPAPAAEASGGKDNRGIIFAILGGSAILTISVVVTLIYTRPAAPTSGTDTKVISTGSGAQAQGEPPKVSAPPLTSGTTPGPSATEPGLKATPPPTGGTIAVKARPDVPPTPSVKPAATPDIRPDMFNKGEAAASLSSINIASCKKADSPTGDGHVTVTFGNDGNVLSAIVDEGVFPGTPVGGCIAGKFRGARVSPFSGSPVKVGKSFSLR